MVPGGHSHYCCGGWEGPASATFWLNNPGDKSFQLSESQRPTLWLHNSDCFTGSFIQITGMQ